MLGRFLEYAVAAPDPRASLEFYSRLGFAQASVGEAWPHAYAVATDGRIAIGLHGNPDFAAPSIIFVRPRVLEALDALEARGLAIEFRHLGHDEFNEIGWRDPSGHLVRLVEARTFSPAQSAQRSACGYFREIGLPGADPDAGKRFWEPLGFVGLDEPGGAFPHISLTSDSIDLGLYARAQLRAPTLVFEIDDPAAVGAQLMARGVPVGQLPGLPAEAALCLEAPEGTRLLLLPG